MGVGYGGVATNTTAGPRQPCMGVGYGGVAMGSTAGPRQPCMGVGDGGIAMSSIAGPRQACVGVRRSSAGPVQRSMYPSQSVHQQLAGFGSSYSASTGLGSRPLPTFSLENCSGTSRIGRRPIRDSQRQTVRRFVAASHRAATCTIRVDISEKLN